MSHSNSRSIHTEELAERILENLDDFFSDDLISSAAYSKKSSFTQVLRAINHADRITSRDMNRVAQVVMYVPADTNNIIFAEQYQYVADYIESIDSQEADLIDRDFVYFLGKDRFLDIIDILDRYLYVYNKHPVGGQNTESRIKKLSPEDFMGVEDRLRQLEETYWATPYYEDTPEETAYAYFMPDEGRIVLSKQFKTESFLQFRGRLMPGIVSLRDLDGSTIKDEDWEIYTVLTPHWGIELLVQEALDWLLPMSASDARAIVKQEKAIQKEGFESKKPGDSNVIVPHHSF